MLTGMTIYGGDCPFDKIDKWIDTVNTEFGLSNRIMNASNFSIQSKVIVILRLLTRAMLL